MKRSKKLNRLSWASGVNLCQVKLFAAEDSPSQVSLKSEVQRHQLNTPWRLHTNGIESSELPPGFEDCSVMKNLKKELLHIPLIKWRSPPKFAMRFDWHVAAGEESKEMGAQTMREQKVLEAVYLRSSAIPLSPTTSLNVEEECYDDRQTPLVPIIPIEDEEAAHVSDMGQPVEDPKSSHPSQSSSVFDISSNSKCDTPVLGPPVSKNISSGISPASGADIILAASTAMTAILKSKEQASMIDTELLVNILSDPMMIEKLIRKNEAHAVSVSAPMVTSNLVSGTTPPITALKTNDNIINHQIPLSNVSGAPQFASKVTASIPLPSPIPPTKSMYNDASMVQASAVISAPHPSISPPYTSNAMIRPSSNFPCSESDLVTSKWPLNQNIHAKSNWMQQVRINTIQRQPNPVTAQSMLPGQENFVLPLRHPSRSSIPTQSNFFPDIDPVKDLTYFKNLIREHGEQKQENANPTIPQHGSNNLHNPRTLGGLTPADSRIKFRKPCMYFSSQNGCRRGSECPYQHDTSFQYQGGNILEAPRVKKMKLNR